MDRLWLSLYRTAVLKEKKVLSLEELPALLKSVTLDDNIGHIFTLDMEFSDINPKTLLFDEIYPPIFEKNKKISPHERSTSQIMSRAQKKKRQKWIFVTIYAEDLLFFNDPCWMKSPKNIRSLYI